MLDKLQMLVYGSITRETVFLTVKMHLLI